jgi:hypothetical protein
VAAGLVLIAAARNVSLGMLAVVLIALGTGLISFVNIHTMAGMKGKKGKTAGVYSLFTFGG